MELKTSQAALRSYQNVGSVGSLTDARPYDVIATMLTTLLTRIAEAKGHMQRQETAGKAEGISKALGLLEGLILSLDTDRGGDIASNLLRLYEYVSRLLIQANLKNEPGLLDEAASLLTQLKSGWEEIPVELRG